MRPFPYSAITVGGDIKAPEIETLSTLLHATAKGAEWLQVEKLPGGSIEDCRVLKGVMFQKDVVAPGRMRRKISAPRVLLLDCPLEYKKGENQTNVELTKEEDWCALWPASQQHTVFIGTQSSAVAIANKQWCLNIACHEKKSPGG